MKKLVLVMLLIVTVVAGSSVDVKAWGSTFSDASDRDFGTSTYSYLSAGEINMFHYDVSPSGKGAYNLYSTGSTDTYAYLYERNGIWPFEHYDLLKSNDDSGESLNFRIERDLDNYEDYYVKVRGFSTSTTGSYRLYFEPNIDKEIYSNGGEWIQNSTYYDYQYNTDKKIYLPPEAIPYFLAMLDEDTNLLVQDAFANYGIEYATNILASVVGYYIGGGVGTAIVFGLVSNFLTDLIPAFDTIQAYTNTINDLCDKNVQYVNGLPRDVYTYGLAVDYSKVLVTIYSEYSTISYYHYGLDFEKWTNNTIEGTIRERGTINKYDETW